MLHQIGAGALGPVFHAYEPDRDRHVAIKLFRLDLPPDRVHQLVAGFEKLVAAGLTHPGIATPIAAGSDGNSAYLAQGFVAGDSLDVLIRDYGPAPPVDAMKVAVQLAGALDFAAVVHTTHGALHPRDVLLTNDEARVTGLGVTRALERVGAAAPIRRPYTAPERITGGRWDRRADVFSLAAIVYEMLWGRRVQGTGSQAAAGLAELPGGDLGTLRAVFARALAERPDDRFNTALEFAAALKRAFPRVESRPATVHSQEPASTSQEPILVTRPAKDEGRLSTPAPPLAVADVEIRAAEADRFHDVEVAPAIVPRELSSKAAMPLRTSSEILGLDASRGAGSALDRSRSATWPLALALAVGLAVGFAAGFAAGNRDRPLTQSAAPAAALPPETTALQPRDAQTAPSTPTVGREFTDAALNEPKNIEKSATSRPTGTSAAADTTGLDRSRGTAADRRSGAGVTAPAGTAAVDGRLVVRSTPAGARVFVDGRERGRTPATIRDLARGTHRVRVVQDGFATEERRVVLSGSRRPQSITVALARARAEPAARPADAFYGALSVDSLPPGAKVFIDGKLTGSTPMLLPQVGAGEHVVRLEHDGGYRAWSSSVRVVAGERNRVTASLEK